MANAFQLSIVFHGAFLASVNVITAEPISRRRWKRKAFILTKHVDTQPRYQNIFTTSSPFTLTRKLSDTSIFIFHPSCNHHYFLSLCASSYHVHWNQTTRRSFNAEVVVRRCYVEYGPDYQYMTVKTPWLRIRRLHLTASCGEPSSGVFFFYSDLLVTHWDYSNGHIYTSKRCRYTVTPDGWVK